MRFFRPHWKVFLVWWTGLGGYGWAVQLVLMPELALGIRFEYARPLLDLYVGPLTIAIGKHPVQTHASGKWRNICRGFIVDDQPEAAVL